MLIEYIVAITKTIKYNSSYILLNKGAAIIPINAYGISALETIDKFLV